MPLTTMNIGIDVLKKNVILALLILLHQLPGFSRVKDQDINQEFKANIIISIGLIWEGIEILDHNIQSIVEFRRRHPDINLIQFLNPAYYTKKDGLVKIYNNKIHSTIYPDDIIGLHIHPWKNLVHAAGIEFRKEPTFWGYDLEDQYCKVDCGHEVPLSVYKKEEIRSLISYSLKLFKENHINEPQIFMSGAWMGSPQILDTLMQNNIFYDASAISPTIIKDKIKYFPLADWLNNLWSNLKFPLQPQLYYTSHGLLKQMIHNGGPLDHRQNKEILSTFINLTNSRQASTEKNIFFHLDIYQETAWQHLPRLKNLISKIKSICAKNKLSCRTKFELADIFPINLNDLSHVINWKNFGSDRNTPYF